MPFFFFFLTTSWYFSYLPRKCKDWSDWSINGNVCMCESSRRRNQRARGRRKVSVLAKDMTESHHTGKHWGKCCSLQEPEADLQETVDSSGLRTLTPKTSSSSSVQRTQETGQELNIWLFSSSMSPKLSWWEDLATHSNGSCEKEWKIQERMRVSDWNRLIDFVSPFPSYMVIHWYFLY